MDHILIFLTGTWFICFSNFPMWTKGDKQSPSFHYEIVSQSKDKSVLSDEVSYIQNEKKKFIKGYDTQSRSDVNAFVWRGKGLLKLLSSNWRVALRDEQNGQWAVICFSKTLFTPEGVDIISRETSLPKATWELIKVKMSTDPLLAKHLPQIKEL
ncbi:MAG: hypothetical protein H7282_18025 [Cytophagaceae bacterium]|nr:hypothetical protein [Cytophagaceae bacterium]